MTDPVSFIIATSLLSFLGKRVKEGLIEEGKNQGKEIAEDKAEETGKDIVGHITEKLISEKVFEENFTDTTMDELRELIRDELENFGIASDHDADHLMNDCLIDIKTQLSDINKDVVGLQNLIMVEMNDLGVWIGQNLQIQINNLGISLLGQISQMGDPDIQDIFEDVNGKLERQLGLTLETVRPQAMQTMMDQFTQMQSQLKIKMEEMGIPLEVSLTMDLNTDQRGQILSLLKEIENVEKQVERITKKPAGDADTYLRKGNFYMLETDQCRLAIEQYEKALEIKPDYADPWFNMAVAYECRCGRRYGDPDDCRKAIECYEKAVEINPAYASAYFNMGVVYGKLGEHQKAIDSFEKAVEIKPDHESAWYNLGIAYGWLKEYRKAIECFEKTVEIKPDDADAWNFMGRAYFFLGEYDKTLEKAKQALKYEHKNPWIWDTLACGFYGKKDYEYSWEAFQVAQEIQPNFVGTEAIYRRVKSYITRGYEPL